MRISEKVYLSTTYISFCSKNHISIQGHQNEIFSGTSWRDHTVVVLRIVPTIRYWQLQNYII